MRPFHFKKKSFRFLSFFLRFQAKPRRKSCKRYEGEQYNLQEIYEALNRQYFGNKLCLGITWFGNKCPPASRCVVFGAYHERLRLIKIHRRLDRKEIPLHFVSFIVYHEMLHHVLPPISGRGNRRSVHHHAFREREKEFFHYALAQEFRGKFRV